LKFSVIQADLYLRSREWVEYCLLKRTLKHQQKIMQMNRDHHGPKESFRIRSAWTGWARLCPLAALCLCACQTATYDVRRLNQPVLLNNNPSPSSARPVQFTMVDKDVYSSETSFASVVASAGNTTTSSTTSVNQAQVNAFNKIGGQPNRLIHGLTFDVNYVAVNALILLAEKVSITASGNVAETRPIPAANAPSN
jgi:hypothetical protein